MGDISRSTPGRETGARGSLSPEHRRTLAYASAIGREFDFRLLAAALGAEEEPLAEQLEQLVGLGALREREGGDRFVFVQDDIRTQLYQDLTASRLRVIHRKIAEAMEAQLSPIPDEAVPELSRHYFLAQLPQKSYRFNRAAADLAQATLSPEAAISHLERARLDFHQLPHLPAHEGGEVALQLGSLYATVGEHDRAHRCFEEGLAECDATLPGLRGRLLLAQASLDGFRPGGDLVNGSIREARELLERAKDGAGLARLHYILSRAAETRGALREALDEDLIAVELLREDPDAGLSGLVELHLASVFGRLGSEVRDEMNYWFERGVAHLVSVGEFADVARGYAIVGEVVAEEHPSEGLALLLRAREYSERSREPRDVVRVTFRLVGVHLRMGNLAESQHVFEEARRLMERHPDPVAEVLEELARGQIAEWLGDTEDAHLAYEAGLRRALQNELVVESLDAHFLLARLEIRRGEASLATAHLDAARSSGCSSLRPGLARQFAELENEVKTAVS